MGGVQQDGAGGREADEAAVSAMELLADSNVLDDELTAHLRAVLAECDVLAARVAELEAIIAEGNQRDRALALLLIRNGGQVEFTQVEQVTAPQHGQLISYPNLATGGLVLAYSADGETVGAAPDGRSATETGEL